MEIELTKEMIIDELEKQCWHCYGSGFEPKSCERRLSNFQFSNQVCSKCNGKKVVLTELGKELQCYLNEVFPVS